MEELKDKLLKDIRALGIVQDFELCLKPYSKTFYGRYDPNKNLVTVYVYRDSGCKHLYSYEELFMTTLHEVVHCLQWNDPSFVRLRGVMHNTDFYRIYNKYKDRAKAMFLVREVRSGEVLFKEVLSCFS